MFLFVDVVAVAFAAVVAVVTCYLRERAVKGGPHHDFVASRRLEVARLPAAAFAQL